MMAQTTAMASGPNLLRRCRKSAIVSATIIGSLCILNLQNSAEASFGLPDWPLASAGDGYPVEAIPEIPQEFEFSAASARSTIAEQSSDEAGEAARSLLGADKSNRNEGIGEGNSKIDSIAAATKDGGLKENFPPARVSSELSEFRLAKHSDQTESEEMADRNDSMPERIRTLRVTGILERQSEIGEGILLLERQLRHADMVRKFMAIMGPAAPVEVSPGRYEDFSQSPEGRRLAAELRERELESTIRELELQASVNRAMLRLEETEFNLGNVRRDSFGNSNSPAPVLDRSATAALPDISLRAVYGSDGRLAAIVAADESRLEVMEGDILPGGAEVVSVARDRILVEFDGNTTVHTLGWR